MFYARCNKWCAHLQYSVLHVCWSCPSLCMVWCCRPVGLDSDDLVQILLPTCLYIGSGAPHPPTGQFTTVGWDTTAVVNLNILCNAWYWTEPGTQCVEKTLARTTCSYTCTRYMSDNAQKQICLKGVAREPVVEFNFRVDKYLLKT